MDIGAFGIYAFLFLALYFEVFLLISFFENTPGEKTDGKPARYPSVAIIVPCFNEERTLASTLHSLLALEYPQQKLSIIVVNDGSTDGTHTIAKRFAAKEKRILVISKENGGKYTALNLGLTHTEAELVGCLDADSSVAPDALLEIVKTFARTPTLAAVVPAMKVRAPHRALERMQAVEYTFGIFYKKMFDNLAAISVLPGPFSFYRRTIFDIVGPFRHAYNTEDMEMAFRLHAHGLTIENAHTALVYTNVPTTIRALIKQRTRWTQGFLQNSRDYAYMYFNPRFGYFGMLTLPFALALFIGALYIAGYLLTSMLLHTFAKLSAISAANLPLWRTPHLSLDWFYLNTGMLSVLIVITAGMTIAAVLLGKRIAGGAPLGMRSFAWYFTLYGFIAPLWLARAAWGAARAKTAPWR